MQSWMGRPRAKAAECQYKDYNSLLTDNFISRLNDDGMIDEILKEVAILEDNEDNTSECVVMGM